MDDATIESTQFHAPFPCARARAAAVARIWCDRMLDGYTYIHKRARSHTHTHTHTYDRAAAARR